MKRFISRRVVRVPRYKLIYFVIFSFGVLVLGINILVSLLINDNNEDKIKSFLVANAYGRGFTNYNFFYKNILGFNVRLQEQAMRYDDDNLEDIVSDAPTIYIYNTFQTDKYKSNYYNSYNINAVITQASKILQEYIKRDNIGVLVETESVAKVLKENDIPYTNSYKGSRILLSNARKNNPSLKYFIDIQMSDYEYSVTTASINGINYAKVLFVVGTDNANYLENQKLANGLNNVLNDVNKELSRGVSLRGGAGYQGIYNQDFDSNVILIQVGGVHNTIDEVNRTMEVISRVIVRYIMEENNEEK